MMAPNSRPAVTRRSILVLLVVVATLGALGVIWSVEREANSAASAEEPVLGLAEVETETHVDAALLSSSAPTNEIRTAHGHDPLVDVEDIAQAAEEPIVVVLDAPLQGRVMLLDGHALAGFHVVVEPKRGTTTHCRTNANGEFELSVERDVTYRVALPELIGYRGEPLTSVIAPASGLELRVDALLVRVWPQAHAAAIGRVALSIQPMGDGIARFGMSTGMAEVIAEGKCLERLLPTGPGYLLVADRDGERPLVGMVDPGLLSGVVDVELRESHAACATVGVVVVGAPLSTPNRIVLTLRPEKKGQRLTQVRVASGHVEAWSGAILPGRYTLAARVSGMPPFGWARARVATTELELAAGDVRTVDVELVPAGGLSVQVTVPKPSAKSPESEIKIEVFDKTRDEWRTLSMHVRSPDGGLDSISTLTPFVLHYSDVLFEPGELRVRAAAPGWRTVEGVVDVNAGRDNEWVAALEPIG
jgi:hypothetical protein